MRRCARYVLFLGAAVVLIASSLSAQSRGALALGFGFTESEKPVLSVSYLHRTGSLKIYGLGGVGFFHPGAQVSEGKDPATYFASVFQMFAGVQFGEMLFVAPRVSYNWYGNHRSMGWGISGGFAFRVVPKISLGLVAAHDRLRFDDAVDPYGPSPFTSVSLLARIWLVR